MHHGSAITLFAHTLYASNILKSLVNCCSAPEKIAHLNRMHIKLVRCMTSIWIVCVFVCVRLYLLQNSKFQVDGFFILNLFFGCKLFGSHFIVVSFVSIFLEIFMTVIWYDWMYVNIESCMTHRWKHSRHFHFNFGSVRLGSTHTSEIFILYI